MTKPFGFFDWIWNIKGSLALDPGQSRDEAFGRLDPLFHRTGTSHEYADGALTFRKKDPAAQDKMSIFDAGVLRIEGSVLHYRLASKSLLFCFLAPLLFLTFAAGNIALGKLEKPATEDKAKDDKDKKDEVKPLHWIDQALGAPAPEKPKNDGKDKGDKGKKKHSPTPAYVFAGLFAALYVAGRVLEAKLVKRLFRRSLAGA